MQEIVNKYIEKLKKNCVVCINSEDGEENPLSKLDCWLLVINNNSDSIAGFSIKSKQEYKYDDGDIKFQYYVTGSQYDLRSYDGSRPQAYRIPFLLDSNVCHNKTVSHLCHHNWCYNPTHHILESLETNKGRNGCPGPHKGCLHNPMCLVEGPNARGDNISYSFDINNKTIIKNKLYWSCLERNRWSEKLISPSDT
jgi:hypothetical protein